MTSRDGCRARRCRALAGQRSPDRPHIRRRRGRRSGRRGRQRVRRRMAPSLTAHTSDGADRRRRGYGDSGTYSRFFLIPKAARSDREPLVRGELEAKRRHERLEPRAAGSTP